MEIVPPVVIGDDVVSSTAIRRLVAEGDIERANAMLGHPFLRRGLWLPGTGIGRTMGFPTANIKPIACQVMPACGVYSVSVEIGGSPWLGVANIGTRPTIGAGGISVEVFVIGFSGDLYGQELEVAFKHRLRDEVRFANLNELKAQIVRDVEQTRSDS